MARWPERRSGRRRGLVGGGRTCRRWWGRRSRREWALARVGGGAGVGAGAGVVFGRVRWRGGAGVGVAGALAQAADPVRAVACAFVEFELRSAWGSVPCVRVLDTPYRQVNATVDSTCGIRSSPRIQAAGSTASRRSGVGRNACGTRAAFAAHMIGEAVDGNVQRRRSASPPSAVR